ncbi:MAG: hydrogenase expression/formation protein HypE [Oscillospiraceae bacterium]|jgi:hydrogenase expression/formation protein HypE|nr:hydrogenase expression/formation protein HypE [Oscillospiraceae bacterium]
MKITAAHGSGGKSTSELIENIFAKHFSNPLLDSMEDSTVLPSMDGKIAITTDSFVVTPLFFKGGDIGKLSICGTVNDLLMRGAIPRYVTCGFIIETGTESETLDQIARSMAESAKQAGVLIIAGDTKVINGNGGVYINTTGVGTVPNERDISIYNCKAGDAVLLSGTLGDHHAAILSERMGIKNDIQSDCTVLNEAVDILLKNNIRIKAMRDVTRGGLATILNEIAVASNVSIEIEEGQIPVSSPVKSLCGILGLDPLYMGNEGKFVAVIDVQDKEKAIELLQSTEPGKNAAIIGKIKTGDKLLLKTSIGGTRIVHVLQGEGLPRIC